MKINLKRTIAGSLAAISLTTSLTGCSGTSIIREDVTKFNLPPELTVNEVKEYYKRALDFDSIVTRNIEVHETNYNLNDVDPDTSPETYNKISTITKEAISLLEYMRYVYTEDIARILNEDTYHYIKAFLNDKKLTYQGIEKIQEALGFYFVDVKFGVAPRDVGTITGASSLLGINGAFTKQYFTGVEKIDNDYINMAIKKLNEYYATERINKKASYNPVTNAISTSADKDVTNDATIDFTNTTAFDYTDVDSEQSGQTQDGTQTVPDNQNPLVGPTAEDAENNDTENAENQDGTQKDVQDDTQDDFTTSGTIVSIDDADPMMKIQNPGIDINEWHKVVGSSKEVTAFMPELSMVFTAPEQEVVDNTYIVGGIGILPVGIGGLKRFGFNRNDIKGDTTLRFVFKEDLDRPGEFINTNVYVKDYQVETGISYNEDNSVATFLHKDFGTLIDSADRALSNCDMTALMNGKIFADMRMAILRGYEAQHTNLLRQISTVRRVIKRNVPMNTYVLEVETLRQEGSKGANAVATYMDTSYVAVEQDGKDFVITDWLTVNRVLQKEPDIEPDSVILKRLIALDLAGEVPDNTKKNVEALLDELRLASTYRILSGEHEVDTTNGKVTVKRGMIDCFNPNPEMLSSSDNDSINSGLRSRLVKYGVNVGATLSGKVYDWVGGTEKQAEVMTEELITYTGRDDGIYMKCYYLVSNMEGAWVIDDMQIISEDEVSGTELDTYAERLKQ